MRRAAPDDDFGGERAGAWPWIMLPARLVLFAAMQATVAAALGSWTASVAWWPLTATLVNLVVICLLVWLFAREGRSYWSLFRFERGHLIGDLLVVALAVVASGMLAYIPNVVLATWLFGSPEDSLELFMRPLPVWAVWLATAFPLTIALAELPLYFAYCMPRIEARTGSASLAVGIAALFLAAQHMTLPLIFDASFLLWRGLMFLPFALFVGGLLRWRPRLLPYLVIIHGIFDLSVVAMLFSVAV